MPKKKTAFKELRKIKKRRLVNIAKSSQLKTLTKRFETLLAQKKADEARALLKELFSTIDNQARKGFIHRNAASRKKARLSKAVQRTSAKT